jgi:hypothetical protein
MTTNPVRRVKRKSLGERIQPWGVIAATVLIPLAIWWTNVLAEEERTKLEYVRIAVSILQAAEQAPESAATTDTSSRPGSSRALRLWAVEVLNKSAPVPLGPDITEQLIEGKATLPATYFQAPWPPNGISSEPRFEKLPYDPSPPTDLPPEE